MFVLSENTYFISSYFIFVEPFRLKQIKKRPNRKKNLPINAFFNSSIDYLDSYRSHSPHH